MSSCKKESASAAKEPAWLKQDLLAYYPLDGNVKDSSGNGFDGVPTGVLKPVANKNGKPYSALYFNGSEFNANINNTHFNQDFTISIWVQLEDFTSQYPRLIWGNDCIVLEFARDANPRVLNFYLYHPSAGVFGNLGGVLNFTNWNHIVITNTNGSSNLYINGTFLNKSATARPTIGTGQTNFLKFGRAAADILNFKGNMDNIRFYKRALTAEEVKYLSQN
jgi:hypothetical protein